MISTPTPFDFAPLEDNYRHLLPADRSAAILDLGCGHGRVLAFLERSGYGNAGGIDLDAKAIEWARQHVSLPMTVVEDSIQFLRAQPSRFDTVILKDVLYYFDGSELLDILDAIAGALRPRGKLIVEVFNGATLTGAYIQHKDYRIRRTFTEHSLRAVLSDAGFEVLQLFGVRVRPRTARQWMYQSARVLWSRILRLLYLVERGKDPQNPTIFTKTLIAFAELKPRNSDSPQSP